MFVLFVLLHAWETTCISRYDTLKTREHDYTLRAFGQSTSIPSPFGVFFFFLSFGGGAALPSAWPPDPQSCVGAGADDPDPEGSALSSDALGAILLPERVFPPPVNEAEADAAAAMEGGGLYGTNAYPKKSFPSGRLSGAGPSPPPSSISDVIIFFWLQ